MRIWDRQQGIYIEEQEYEKKKLEFLYHTLPGRILLKLIVIRPWFSRLCARREKSRRSIRKIRPFIQRYSIDLSSCDMQEYDSFDDFFTRTRPYSSEASENELIAPADARLSVFPIRENLSLNIKGSRYTLEELTDHMPGTDAYQNGLCLVYRLAVEDYHRYVFCDSGTVEAVREIPGVLHTVRPVSAGYRVFSRNHRICSVLDTEHFGKLMQIEVGALLVGKIHNHHVRRFSKLQEKGYFSFGGSTIIQLLPEHAVLPDADILRESRNGTEVKVRIGEVIGRRCGC